MVDLLQQAKNVLQGNGLDFEPETPSDKRLDRTDQCKVVWYQWENELSTQDDVFGLTFPSSPTNSQLAASRAYDISNHLETVTFTKTMENGAGSFSITLANSYDWARWMRPGQWLCIAMSGDGDLPLPAEPKADESDSASLLGSALSLVSDLLSSPLTPLPELALPVVDLQSSGPPSPTGVPWKNRLRCVGVIQRVAIKTITTIDGVVETTYVVTGKDFGAVFEESELWFNAATADGLAFISDAHDQTKQFQRNLTELLGKWYDVFLNPRNELSALSTNLKSFFPVQWILPDKLIENLALTMNKSGEGTFGDIVGVKEFNATPFENMDPLPLSGLQGRCWDRLKGLSEPAFHELFTELSDAGNPKLIFRPIPWAMNKDNYPTLGDYFMYYQDLTTGEPQGPVLPLGTNLSSFKSLDALSGALQSAESSELPPDARTEHTVAIASVEVESIDLGPDYHSRANMFLVDNMRHMLGQANSFAVLSKDFGTPWPLRDEQDIRRHGFRPKKIDINVLQGTNNQLFTTYSEVPFLKEANFLLKDFWANAEDYYSGTMVLAGGRNDVKLGKVIITSEDFEGIAEMTFYIEGYTDNFTVNAEGTCSWTQTLTLTRGIRKAVFEGGSTKDSNAREPGTFHTVKNDKGEGGLLDDIKNAIKDPTSLF